VKSPVLTLQQRGQQRIDQPHALLWKQMTDVALAGSGSLLSYAAQRRYDRRGDDQRSSRDWPCQAARR